MPASLSAARAASLYWDGNSTTADADGGAGTWSTAPALTNWDSNASGGSDTPWTDGSAAVLGGSGGAVTISGAVSASSLGFTAPGYNLSGGVITLTGTPAIDVAGNDVTIGSVLAGSSAITKTGTGTLTLAGSNTFTGSFTIAEGIVKAGGANAFGPVQGGITVAAGATLDHNGQPFGTEAVSISGTGVNGGGAIIKSGGGIHRHIYSLTLSAPASVGGTERWGVGSTSSTASLQMGGRLLTKVGPSEFHLQNASVTGGGSMDIKEGGLLIEAQCSLAGTAANVITIREGAMLALSGISLSATLWSVAFEGNTKWLATSNQVTGGSSRWSGPATLAGATNIEVEAGAGLESTGAISGAGSITKTGPGTWTPGLLNTYSGGTTVNAGNLQLLASSSNGSGRLRGQLTVNSGGKLTLSGNRALGTLTGARIGALNIAGGLVDQTIAAGSELPGLNFSSGTLRSNQGNNDPAATNYFILANDAPVSSSASAQGGLISGRLHLGTGNSGNTSIFNLAAGNVVGDLRIDAAITEAAAGSGITKRGPGLLLLNGPALFSGETRVEEGTLLISTDGSLSSSPVFVAAGGRFGTRTAGKSLAALTVQSGSSLILPATTGAGTTVAGTLSLVAGNIGVSPILGADASAAGVYDLVTATGGISGSGNPVLDLAGAFGSTRATGSVAVNGNKLQLTLTGTGSELLWNNASAGGAASGTWNTAFANFSNNGVNDAFQAFDSVTFNDSVAAGTAKSIALGATLAPARITVDNSDGDYTFTAASGGLAGAGSLVKTGSSKLSFVGSDSYRMSGSITAGGGVIDLGGQSLVLAGLSLSGGAFDNATATLAALDLQSGSASATLRSSAAWTKSTAGTLTLSANNSLSGPGTIQAGHLVLGNQLAPSSAGSLGTGSLSIASGASLTIARNNAATLSNALSGSGNLNVLGNSNVSNSSVTLAGDNSAFSGPVTVSNAGLILSNGNALGSGPLSLSGFAGLQASDASISNPISLTPGGSWTGGTVGSGNLILDDAVLAGPITLSGSTSTRIFVDDFSSITGPVLEAGGPAAVTFSFSAGGRLTLAGACTYTGNTQVIGSGTLKLTGSLGATAVSVTGLSTIAGNGTIANGGSLAFGFNGGLATDLSGNPLTVNGNVNLGDRTNVIVATELTPPPNGPIPILRYTGTLTGDTANLVLENSGLYRQPVFAVVPGAITLEIGRKTIIWKGPGGNTWSTGGGTMRWGTSNSGPATDYYYEGDHVVFNDNGGGGLISGTDVRPSSVLFQNNTVSYSTSASIGGPCALTKSGTGTVTLYGGSTYTGGTTISAGKVVLGSTGLGSGPVSIAAAGTLAGTGNIGAATIAGTIDPGTPGDSFSATLTTGSVALTGTYASQLTPSGSDKLVVNGDLNLTGAKLVLSKDFTSTNTDTYVIASYTGNLSGSFATVTGMIPGYAVKADTANKQIVITHMTFSDWAAAYPGLSDVTAAGDPDGDGISNLVEYALAGDPGLKGLSILPTHTVDDETLFFRYKRSDPSKYDTTQIVQWSQDLANWTDIPVTASTSAGVAVATNGNAPDDVTVIIPRVGDRIFARLKVTQP